MSGSILLVFAHPDDETSSSAGTIARYSRLGVSIDLICVTGGEKGTRLGIPPEMETAPVREAELLAAAAVGQLLRRRLESERYGQQGTIQQMTEDISWGFFRLLLSSF